MLVKIIVQNTVGTGKNEQQKTNEQEQKANKQKKILRFLKKRKTKNFF
jgi:hypothetical protein